MSSRQSRVLTDHDEIREWVESRGGCPAEVKRTARGDRTGIIRIDFPGWSGRTTLRQIPWDDFFRKFDENDLALVVEETTSRGQRSNFNKLVGRETAAGAEPRRARRRTSTRGSSRAGGTGSRTRASGTRSTSARKTTARKTTAGPSRTGRSASTTSRRGTGTGRTRTGTSGRARTGERRAAASTSARTQTAKTGRGATARKSSRTGARSTRTRR